MGRAEKGQPASSALSATQAEGRTGWGSGQQGTEGAGAGAFLGEGGREPKSRYSVRPIQRGVWAANVCGSYLYFGMEGRPGIRRARGGRWEGAGYRLLQAEPAP